MRWRSGHRDTYMKEIGNRNFVLISDFFFEHCPDIH